MKFYQIVTLLQLIAFLGFSQSYNYNVDLENCIDDKLTVELTDIKFKGEELKFNFPKTIPGTYAVEDYGKYIESFKAYDSEGNELKVKTYKKNTFIIKGAIDLNKISYQVNDTWDSGEKKNKIFEPAGTNFEKDKNFVLNNCGLFGYFDNEMNHEYKITFKKPSHFYGASAMPSEIKKEKQIFTSRDYHQLVDCPILFSKPDTANFKVANTDVTIAVYNERGGQHAAKVYDELKESMDAIADFVGNLPVDNYTFLIFLKDKSKLGTDIATNGFSMNIMMQLMQLGGVGALEHGNSSLYYLVDLGDVELEGPLKQLDYINTLKDVAIHEFMHIFTPLNLHSEHIGNFNYIAPEMSQHLWLYEGITEYFAGLIQLRAGIKSPEEYFTEVMRGKIIQSNKYPEEKMTFSEMSENILEKKYHKHYMQVYQRGAVMGLLLDLEIMRLTDNKKTLRDVIVSLSSKYGPTKSFDEKTFFDEMAKEVHPDLRNWFTLYIEGHNPLPIQEQLNSIGWDYEQEHFFKKPMTVFETPGVKFDKSLNARISGQTTVTSISPEASTPLQVGDELNIEAISKMYKDKDGNWLEEGEEITIKVIRGGRVQKIKLKIELIDAKQEDFIGPVEKPSSKQIKKFNIWANIKEENIQS